MTEQPSLLAWSSGLAHFDGETYVPSEDYARLKTQLDRVRHLLTHPTGRWWTIAQLNVLAGGSEASTSARIRDLRKMKFGGYYVEHRRVENEPGLWQYRVLPELET